ncbi:MAG: hypothetical protein Q4C96_04425 [Planctomycetia bacterium]|nr:hypothetical protein [Planctomycetia bacterium]
MFRGKKNRRGALTFEWIVIVTLLVIGMIGGLGVLRNTILLKVTDMAESVDKLNTAASASTSPSP